MGGEREQVDVLRFHIDRDIADCLNGIGVERDLVLPGNGTEFRDGFDGANLVVGVHDRDEDCLIRDRFFKFVRIDKPGTESTGR